jgi:hypothetical protein
MLAVRTPGAPHTTRTDAACDSAFPLERQGRLLRSRSISGLYSRSLHSGLQPPCLRFATAVTGRHARLGSRLLARLCRGRHLRRQTSTRLQGATLPKPDVTVSVSSGFPVLIDGRMLSAVAIAAPSATIRRAPAVLRPVDGFPVLRLLRPLRRHGPRSP